MRILLLTQKIKICDIWALFSHPFKPVRMLKNHIIIYKLQNSIFEIS